MIAWGRGCCKSLRKALPTKRPLVRTPSGTYCSVLMKDLAPSMLGVVRAHVLRSRPLADLRFLPGLSS